MTSIDQRTRADVDPVAVDVDTFVDELAPGLVDAHGREAERSARRLGLPPLTLDVDGARLTLRPVDDEGLVVEKGGAADLVVVLDRDAFSDLVQDVVSTFGVQMTGRAAIASGSVDDFVAWEPVLRTLLDGRAVYERGSVTLVDRAGGPLDLHRSFRPDDDPDEIGHFLGEAGFLHLTAVFTEEEMAAVSADLDDAVAAAEQDDGASWWARTGDGEWYPSRILGFNQRSAALRTLLHDERFTRIGMLSGDDYRQQNPDHGDSAEGLLKKVDVVEGISDVSWHKDCSMGGHGRHCSRLVVGISVTGAGPESGELGVVAGSHRANVVPLGADGLDLPKLPLPTSTGDVTVHCSCTMHMSRPPVSASRRVVYTGFDLAARPGDQRRQRTEDEERRDRASLNDHVRNQTSLASASFEL